MTPDMQTGLVLTFIGLLIVFGVLLLLAVFISFISKLDQGWQEDEKEIKAKQSEKTPTIDSLTLVLISAAVTAAIGHRRHQIKKIKLVRSNHESWSLAGRQGIMGSHNLQKSGGYK
jgi:sodium pump decarboxylase gamma subunit